MKYFGIVFMALLAPVAFANESLDSTAQRMLKMGKAGKSMSLNDSNKMKSMKSSKSSNNKKSSKSMKSATAEALTELLSFTLTSPRSTIDLEATIISILASNLSEDRRRLIDNDFLDTFFKDWLLELVESVCDGSPCVHVAFFASGVENFAEILETTPDLIDEIFVDLAVALQEALQEEGISCIFIPPTPTPTDAPTIPPTDAPTISIPPTNAPTFLPTDAPSISIPPTDAPSTNPSTDAPSTYPTVYPFLEQPFAPFTFSPTYDPTISPTYDPTISPTDAPTISIPPTDAPTISIPPTAEICCRLKLDLYQPHSYDINTCK